MASAAFKLVRKARANGLIDVAKYISARSGLTVTIADVEGPLVNGYLCLVTETDSNDGLPHTLEHLVFMGSKHYPYKGVLDLLANRCLASGTNAWTAQDHTCYTMSTAGQEGFLKLLPIYINHIIQPMLTDAQFMTEVHHINGEGENAGVVYSEMQEHESKMINIVDRAVKENMYPEGSGYTVETGGRLLNLRTSCSNEKVKNFHEQFYRMQNLNIIVAGTVEHESILKTVEAEETRLLVDRTTESGFEKPFRTPIPPLDKVTELSLDCPADDVTRGMVIVAWRGPAAVEVGKLEAVEVLLDYLSDTAVSPLERDFIQVPDPYCSSIECSVNENWESYVEIFFSGVPVEKLSEIRQKLRQTIDGLINGSDPFDTQRMGDIIKQRILRSYSQLETNPHGTVASSVMSDFLYGESETDVSVAQWQFDERLNDVSTLKKLKEAPGSYWLDLLKEYFGQERKYVSVVGVPNSAYVEKMTEEEKQRIENQQKNLGEDGLKNCGEKLEKALAENEEGEPPSELVDECVVNSLNGIKFVKLESSTNLDLERDRNQRFPLVDFPFTAMLDDCKTNFVEICATLDTSALTEEERPLLVLWENILFESSMRKDGKLLPYEEVVKQLNRDLVSYNASIGMTGRYRTYLRVALVELKLSQDDYERGVEWLKDILSGVVFDSERIKVVAQRLENAAAAKKRDGFTVARFLLDHLMLEQGSNPYLCHVLRLEKCHRELVRRLETDAETVVNQLTELHRKITRPECLAVHVMCNTANLGALKSSDLLKVWREQFGSERSEQRAKILAGNEPLFLDSEMSGKAALVAIGASEAAHVIVAAPGIRKADHPDLPGLMLFLQYMDQCEGPLWKQIRGKGLAYGANVYPLPDSGTIVLRLFRAAQPVQAYEETKSLIEKFLSGEEKMDEVEFEAAKRSLVFEIIDREDTVVNASLQSLFSYFRGVGQKYNLQLCKRIWDMCSMEEVIKVGEKYVRPLMNFSQSVTAITCHPSKSEEVVSGFKNMGCDLKEMTLEDEELTRWDFRN